MLPTRQEFSSGFEISVVVREFHVPSEDDIASEMGRVDGTTTIYKNLLKQYSILGKVKSVVLRVHPSFDCLRQHCFAISFPSDTQSVRRKRMCPQ